MLMNYVIMPSGGTRLQKATGKAEWPKEGFRSRIVIPAPDRLCEHGTDVSLDQKSLCSSVMSDSGSSPTQARKMLVRALRCLAKALMTGVPGGVSGALSM